MLNPSTRFVFCPLVFSLHHGPRCRLQELCQILKHWRSQGPLDSWHCFPKPSRITRSHRLCHHRTQNEPGPPQGLRWWPHREPKSLLIAAPSLEASETGLNRRGLHSLLQGLDLPWLLQSEAGCPHLQMATQTPESPTDPMIRRQTDVELPGSDSRDNGDEDASA